MTTPMLPDIRDGMLVITSDGAELGRVKLIEGDRFKIDVPLGIDYWLHVADVARIEQGVVLLAVSHEQVQRHRHESGSNAGPILSSEE